MFSKHKKKAPWKCTRMPNGVWNCSKHKKPKAGRKRRGKR